MMRRFLVRAITTFAFVTACSRGDSGVAQQQARSVSATPVAATSQPDAQRRQPATTQPVDGGRRSNVGFRSRAQFDEHFQKHGAEFGHVTQQEYLRAAQTLRDAPVGGNIEEIRRDDGTSSRFDRSTGAFLAFNRDGTIRTFFKPNDGEAYFRRQASRVH